MENNKIIKAYNKHHLGDNIFNILFFNNISKYLEKNNIIIYYYLKPCYKKQALEFVNTNNIKLFDYDENNEGNMGLHLWIEEKIFRYKYNPLCRGKLIPYNSFLMIFFNEALKKWKLPIAIKSIIYDDPELNNKYNNLCNLNPKYANIDLLIINSIALSGQFDCTEINWINFIRKFTNNNYNIVITNKINSLDIKCTTDDNLTIKDIAALSTHSKIIIFVNSGVAPGLLNIHTLNNAKALYCLDNYTYYLFPKFQKIKNYKNLNQIPINEIKSLL